MCHLKHRYMPFCTGQISVQIMTVVMWNSYSFLMATSYLLKLIQVFLYLILISLGVPFLTLVIHFEQDQHCSCHNEILLSCLLLFFLPFLTTFSPNLFVVITILNLIAPSLLYLDCHLYFMLTFLLI